MEDEFEDKEVALEERVISEPETPRLERWAISRLRSAIESAGDIVILFVPHAVRIRNVIGGMLKVATVTQKNKTKPENQKNLQVTGTCKGIKLVTYISLVNLIISVY